MPPNKALAVLFHSPPSFYQFLILQIRTSLAWTTSHSRELPASKERSIGTCLTLPYPPVTLPYLTVSFANQRAFFLPNINIIPSSTNHRILHPYYQTYWSSTSTLTTLQWLAEKENLLVESPREARLAQRETRNNKVILAKLVSRLVLRSFTFLPRFCIFADHFFGLEKLDNDGFLCINTPPSRVKFSTRGRYQQNISSTAGHSSIPRSTLQSSTSSNWIFRVELFRRAGYINKCEIYLREANFHIFGAMIEAGFVSWIRDARIWNHGGRCSILMRFSCSFLAVVSSVS
jgi:hypothetical protein